MSFPGSIQLTERMIRQETVDQRHPLGTRGYLPDGRVYHYCKNGATALNIGSLNQTPTAHAHFTDGQDLMVAATTLSTSITLHSTDSSLTTANALAEGYLLTKDAAVQGQLMVIQSHPLKTTTGNCKFNLETDSTLTAALTTGTSICGFWHNVYQDVIVTPAGIPTGIPVGVNTMAISASYYFWIQTWGPCLCLLTSAAAVVGHGMQSDSDNAGEMIDGCTHSTATSLANVRPFVGACMEVGAADDHALIYLTIAP